MEDNTSNDLRSVICGSPDRPVRLGDIEIPCYVLDDEKRVLVLSGLLVALDMKPGSSGKHTGAGDRLSKFVGTKAISPYVSEELMSMTTNPIKFKNPLGGGTAFGYEATILAEICDAVLSARRDGKLNFQQKHIAERCELLLRGFARVGIIALVDEATGYQDIRVKNSLEEILNKFLLEHQKPYIGTFPIEFYRVLFKLNNWPWNPSSTKRPGVIGRWTNDIVYERLAPGILEKLKEKNPTSRPGQRKHKHFQFLTDDYGDPALRAHFGAVIALGKIAPNMRKFWSLLNRALPKYGEQLMLDYDELDD